MQRTCSEINEKIKAGKASVLTALEAKSLIAEKGFKTFLNTVDIVTTASFEMNTNSVLYLNFGQTDPLIYFSEVSINNVPAYPAGPTDLVLPCVSFSKDDHKYSGANVLEELIKGNDLHLKAIGRNLEVFPNKEFETWFNLKNLNHGRLLLNQAVNQNNIVATNSGDKDINSHMGTLIAHLENSTYNSSSCLNPLVNDPFCKTIGIGSRIWVAGATGYIVGHGSNHNPLQKRNDFNVPVGSAITLSAIAEIGNMNSKWVRGGFLKSFGPVLYIGVGIPIPVLNEEIASSIAITDDKIHSTIVDFSIPRRTKPTFGLCTYSELRSSTVLINKKPTLSAPLSSMAGAIEITQLVKESILSKNLLLSEPISAINMNVEVKKLDSRLAELV
ncbi:MAG: hypothetical protein HY094_02350 [Candidatus Melainabacteria bacterium]|nr:hypothetical protein [Candidatus Melainabacteria bacterium]